MVHTNPVQAGDTPQIQHPTDSLQGRCAVCGRRHNAPALAPDSPLDSIASFDQARPARLRDGNTNHARMPVPIACDTAKPVRGLCFHEQLAGAFLRTPTSPSRLQASHGCIQRREMRGSAADRRASGHGARLARSHPPSSAPGPSPDRMSNCWSTPARTACRSPALRHKACRPALYDTPRSCLPWPDRHPETPDQPTTPAQKRWQQQAMAPAPGATPSRAAQPTRSPPSPAQAPHPKATAS